MNMLKKENLVMVTPLLSSRTKQRIRNHDSVTLEFNLRFQDNSLSCDDAKEQELNQRQIAIYKLISHSLAII